MNKQNKKRYDKLISEFNAITDKYDIEGDFKKLNKLLKDMGNDLTKIKKLLEED